MKLTQILTGLTLLGVGTAAHGQIAGAYWSFQNAPTATGAGTYTEAVSVETLPGAPTYTRAGSSLGDFSWNSGDPTPYTAFDGTDYTTWGSEASSFGTGSTNNSFQIQFDSTGLANFQVSFMEYSNTASGFSLVDFGYSIDGGSNFTSVAGVDLSVGANDWTETFSADLSPITAINNQPNVILKWTINEGTGLESSYRIDNLELVAIPEPSTYAALAGLLALGLVAWRRRRA